MSHLQDEVKGIYGKPTPRVTKELFLDGKWAGVPIHTRGECGFARKDLFEAAGIDLSKVRTFDALREAAMLVSDPDNDLWGWGITINRSGDGSYLIHRVIQGFGGSWQDETGQFVALDSPESTAAVEWLVDTYTDPAYEAMLPPDIFSWTDSSNNEAYLNGKVAYTQNAGTVYARAVAEGREVAGQTAYHPPVDGPVVQEMNGLGGISCHIISGAKNAPMAGELILSFFTDAVMEGIYKAAVAYALPAYEPMWEWDLITSNPVSVELKQAALDRSAWNGIYWPGPNNGHMDAVDGRHLDTDLIANVTNGVMTAKESVKNIDAKMVGIFKEFGAPSD